MSELSRFTIRTSDRRVFRRCLRKWDYMSSLRQNLQRQGAEQNINFWFGSAIHFAMEDYFSYNRFGDPRRAFKAYYEAFSEDERPEGAAVHYDLGIAMLTYFLDWYPRHNRTWEFETIWFNKDMEPVPADTEGAQPGVELQFFLDLGMKVVVDAKTEQIIGEYKPGNNDGAPYMLLETKPLYTLDGPCQEILYYVLRDDPEAQHREAKIVPIHYHGTVDRVVVDKFGRWWILDYKTAKGADTNKLDTDDQISAYIWAMEQILKHKIYGFVYLQLTKDIAKPPKRLKDGSYSVDKKQKTTHHLVREALIAEYGSIQKAPMKYIDFLNTMAEKETPEGDRFIRWDFVQRTANQLISTYNHIMGELRTMINPNLYLYPCPTRDCIWDCPLRDICIAQDDAREQDVKFWLETMYEKRPRGEDGKEADWRSKLKWPTETLPAVEPSEFAMDLENMFDIVLPDEYADYE
jgi:hypothetical protein